MKKNLSYLAIAMSLLAVAACKKSDPKPDSSNGITFTINGNTYTEASSQYSVTDVSDESYATLATEGKTSDGKRGILIFYFNRSTKPVAGTYTIVSDIKAGGANTVGILAEDNISKAKSGLYSSQTGTSATVTVSSSGKLSIKFPSTAFKGTNFDNSDPTNTVTTNVDITAQGSAVEN